LASVPSKDAGIGSGIVNVSQQVSAALSVAVLGTVSASRTSTLLAQGRSLDSALDGGYRLAFAIALTSVLVGIVVGAIILKHNKAGSEDTETAEDLQRAVDETMIVEVL
jgi:hypothetical protein